jgi:hypothetical protein
MNDKDYACLNGESNTKPPPKPTEPSSSASIERANGEQPVDRNYINDSGDDSQRLGDLDDDVDVDAQTEIVKATYQELFAFAATFADVAQRDLVKAMIGLFDKIVDCEVAGVSPSAAITLFAARTTDNVRAALRGIAVPRNMSATEGVSWVLKNAALDSITVSAALNYGGAIPLSTSDHVLHASFGPGLGRLRCGHRHQAVDGAHGGINSSQQENIDDRRQHLDRGPTWKLARD